MKNLEIIIVGITNKKQTSLPKGLDISTVDYYGGGSRHHDLVAHLLPVEHCWTDITVPLVSFFNVLEKKQGKWVIFASGDPLFFGIGNTLLREFPKAVTQIIPVFNSIQILAHRTRQPYALFDLISLTGRPWVAFDAALIEQKKCIALLTDRKKTPVAIAQRMLQYGFDNYTMYVGERLGGEQEQIFCLSVQEAATRKFESPNCILLVAKETKPRYCGVSESLFEGLENRPKMITKMPVRITTLAYMDIVNRKHLWDVGFCTGSVSIDAKLHNPLLGVDAFEIRTVSKQLMEKNTQRFGVPGIVCHIGDYLQMDKSEMQRPDAVFLGGYGGKMEEIMQDITKYLLPKGIVAFNSVSVKSLETFREIAARLHYDIQLETTIQVDAHNPITILIAQKL